jgi:ankyrin repeat protein
LTYFGRTGRLAKLLKHDPSRVHVRRPSGKTLLHVLQENTPFEAILDLLVARGADLDALDGEGRTPLGVAADAGFTDVPPGFACAGRVIRPSARSRPGDVAFPYLALPCDRTSS